MIVICDELDSWNSPHAIMHGILTSVTWIIAEDYRALKQSLLTLAQIQGAYCKLTLNYQIT